MNLISEIHVHAQPAAVALFDRLEEAVHPRLRPTYSDLRDEVLADAEDRARPQTARRHARVLVGFCNSQRNRIADLQQAETQFHTRHATAVDDAERRAAILEFARSLGADPRQLRKDNKAFSKFFDADAALERFARRVNERERALAYGLERLGAIAGQAVADDPTEAEGEFFIELFGQLVAETRVWRGDARVRRAAQSCTRQIAERLTYKPTSYWLDVVVGATRRICLDRREDAWTQCEALDTLLLLSPQSIASVIKRRIASADEGVDKAGDGEVFVLRHHARLVCRNSSDHKRLRPLVSALADHDNGAVRQIVAEEFAELPRDLALAVCRRLREDADPQVRAMVIAHPAKALQALGTDGWAKTLYAVLASDDNEFVLRMALDVAATTIRLLVVEKSDALKLVQPLICQGIAQVQKRTQSAKMRRWADEANERIWLVGDSEAQEIAALLAETVGPMREGKMQRIRKLRPYLKSDREKVGRVMALLALNDFGISLEPGPLPVIQRGELLRRRLWRIMFEGGKSSTDKRQAFLHTTGRHFTGSMIAPSARMAELAPTKVPGEPLFESGEGGWRNYLPLLDNVLSALDRGGKSEIYTSAGITTITAPVSFFKRIWLFWKISRNFVRLATLRNREPDEFVKRLRSMGVGIEHRPHGSLKRANPEVTKLFSAGGGIAILPLLLDRASAYFSTVYENSLLELGIFLGLACVFFFGRHMLLGWKARRLREGISLVLGGWGTRGKSGTERLKAGLINALGPSIVSKTTGCEAMFLHGTPFGGLTEMFLFRPYDKATIWEQYNLLKTARGLNGRVFLWECMGLNPSYVAVLQQDWMRDDIGTITNTYPDHEDVQGPAGRNIPEVMCQFIPHNSTLLTTEEEMLPILAEGADKAGTRMRPVGWREAGLIHKNLLERFPYEEHPYNIALVTAMGDELGLEPDFCIKEMADRVVADLGVLKTYPRSLINGRTLEFVMGMSANERFGAMGNWTRMGFDQHDLSKDPEIFVSTVVNNRADRVPRSRVFARMLVNDVSADKHVLIGSNIDGLIGFIEEEWEAYASGLTLSEEGKDPKELFEALAKKQRIPVAEGELDGRLRAMLAPQLGEDQQAQACAAAREGRLAKWLEQAGVAHAEAIAAHHAELAELYRAYIELAGNLGRGASGSGADQSMRTLLGKAFHAKLLPVRDYYMKGEAIVRLVADSTPPGLVNRIMGMQNIKGTGLDWVYRWQAWEAVWKACQQVQGEDPSEIVRAYRLLSSFQEFGALSEVEVCRVIDHLRDGGEGAGLISAMQVDALEARLNAQLHHHDAASGEEENAGSDEQGWFARMGGKSLSLVEAFVDPGDAVRRRRRSEKIYQALIAEQISSQRAATELKELTSRQKGGWLSKSIKQRSSKLLERKRAA